MLVATRHSAAAYKPTPPTTAGGLLIADECHGLGGGILRRALLRQYKERLGLTATLERSDDAVTELLLPYFGGICYRYGFEQAIADGVCARPRVAFVGVPLSVDEQAEYAAVEHRLVSARQHLRAVRDMPLEPFGDFLAAVAHLAERDAGADGRAARDYLDAFSKRRQIVAQTIGKYELLGQLGPAIKDADGALVFTETVRAANHAINRLDPIVAIELITGSTARRQRREILDDLRVRRLDAVAAPRVLDEGIDVPDANLGIVMSASRTRRQMIQRMGRILRRKRSGVSARFVIMFAKDTLEDPANRIERDGFLDEIERISEATGVFDSAHFDELDAFLAAPGPEVVRDPENLESYERAVVAAGVRIDGPVDQEMIDSAGARAGGRDDLRAPHLRPTRRARSRGSASRSAGSSRGSRRPTRARHTWSSSSRRCRSSSSRASSPSACRPDRSRSRSHASAPSGASAAPAAARHHPLCNSAGSFSTRRSPAAAPEARVQAAGSTNVQGGGFACAGSSALRM